MTPQRETFLTFDLDIQIVWVDTECQVAGQCPRCGGPGDQTNILILNQGEVDNHRRILNVLEMGEIHVGSVVFVIFHISLTYLIQQRWLLESTNLVVLMGLKVWQGSVAGSGERHHFDSTVHHALIIELLEHPPKKKKGQQSEYWECADSFLTHPLQVQRIDGFGSICIGDYSFCSPQQTDRFKEGSRALHKYMPFWKSRLTWHACAV